ncbi:MAG: preprotein translocase subunit SecE [Deltaproteobacteria bacterium RIFOXYA12_FULL_58_15]|nr:MAG: preprotein translocase subunit SecE [Deltaproteobacteria bacterium RIFOXYA12_FULL_58_15]OGR08278.1 MAG: preprotein translocase subunit SecE [Deltaproteobacteria bacterium RIFOXYB12_FULL_58_9]
MGIVVLAIVVAFPLAHILGWSFGYFGIDDPPILSRDLPLTTVMGYGIALAAGVFCFVHKRTFALAMEVAEEMSKVTWPSREETGNATVVVLATVVICSIGLGAFDAVWLWLTNLVLGIGTGDVAAGS